MRDAFWAAEDVWYFSCSKNPVEVQNDVKASVIWVAVEGELLNDTHTTTQTNTYESELK